MKSSPTPANLNFVCRLSRRNRHCNQVIYCQTCGSIIDFTLKMLRLHLFHTISKIQVRNSVRKLQGQQKLSNIVEQSSLPYLDVQLRCEREKKYSREFVSFRVCFAVECNLTDAKLYLFGTVHRTSGAAELLSGPKLQPRLTFFFGPWSRVHPASVDPPSPCFITDGLPVSSGILRGPGPELILQRHVERQQPELEAQTAGRSPMPRACTDCPVCCLRPPTPREMRP